MVTINLIIAHVSALKFLISSVSMENVGVTPIQSVSRLVFRRLPQGARLDGVQGLVIIHHPNWTQYIDDVISSRTLPNHPPIRIDRSVRMS